MDQSIELADGHPNRQLNNNQLQSTQHYNINGDNNHHHPHSNHHHQHQQQPHYNQVAPLDVAAAAAGPTAAVAANTKTTSTASTSIADKRRTFVTQPSTVATRKEQAICVRGARKQYGAKNNPNLILDGLNMTVPMGTM